MIQKSFSLKLLAWFDQHGRKDLPWQLNQSPYRIWVSEIMLQQTQVATVIPYYNRFIDRFPTVEQLASASLDEVLSYWTGLGYYARARNLHKSALHIVEEWNGQLQDNFNWLCSLPGVGRSTAAAISSIAFGSRQPILDGNVKRVLARYHAIQGWPGDQHVSKALWQLSEQHTPFDRVESYTQAIMDLGATLCRRTKPRCSSCPVNESCLAKSKNLINSLPTPRPKKTIPKQEKFAPILEAESGLYLEKRAPTSFWGNLWSFPLLDNKEELIRWFEEKGVAQADLEWLPRRRHTFSHFHLDCLPVRGILENPSNHVMEDGRGVWYNPSTTTPRGFPALVQQLIDELNVKRG